MPSIKTQKAMGIMYGISTLLDNYDAMGLFVGQISYQVIRVEDNIDMAFIQYPCFARPCPKTPRHGFVESRIVNSPGGLHKLWKEVKAQDPDGEIVVGPFIKNANYNAVYVSSGILSVGPGHDGATGGKKSVSFPVAPHNFGSDFHELVRIKKSDAVYLEAVCNRDAGWHLTQVRGGPELQGASRDYVPSKIKIKKVVLPDNNLLEWEKKVKTLESGTVVYGLGHTLASHAAVHCVLHKIPFVTSFKPEVGSTLSPTEDSISALNRHQFRRGVRASLTTSYSAPSKHIAFALSVLHNWAYLRKSEDASSLLGAAIASFVKVGTALVLGEWRHGSGGPKGDRENIYDRVMGAKGQKHLYKSADAFKNFYQDNWTDDFGGLSWADCAWYAHDMWQYIVKMFNKRSKNISDEEVACILDKMNRAINMAHNNGWWFNKVADESLMDFAADHPGLLAFCLSDVYAAMRNKASKLRSMKSSLPKTKNLKPPFAKDNKGKIIWAYIEFRNNDDEECYEDCCYDGGIYATLRYGGDDGDCLEKFVALNRKQLSAVKRAASKYNCSRAYLKVIPGVGFKVPGGKVIKKSGVMIA